MRLILFGTGPFAVPTYRRLIDQHEVLAMVTRPISDSGKRRKSAANPTRDLGEELGLTILDPPSCNEVSFVQQLREFAADLFVVCDYGQILSRDCLAASRLGGINLHGSLLPRYRGAAPIQWSIYRGDRVTGVTVIHMTARLDGGPCLVKSEIEIDPEETAGELEPRLADLGPEAVEGAIEMLANWDGESAIGEKQSREAATKAPRLKKSDGQIDFERSAGEIVNQVRAFEPWPRSFTHWTSQQSGKQPLRLILARTSVVPPEQEQEAGDVEAGRVALCDSTRLWIRTGEGLLTVEEIQPAGKKQMQIADFLRGHQPQIGDLFT